MQISMTLHDAPLLNTAVQKRSEPFNKLLRVAPYAFKTAPVHSSADKRLRLAEVLLCIAKNNLGISPAANLLMIYRHVALFPVEGFQMVRDLLQMLLLQPAVTCVVDQQPGVRQLPHPDHHLYKRSEERRVGKEGRARRWTEQCRKRGSSDE